MGGVYDQRGGGHQGKEKGNKASEQTLANNILAQSRNDGTSSGAKIKWRQRCCP